MRFRYIRKRYMNRLDTKINIRNLALPLCILFLSLSTEGFAERKADNYFFSKVDHQSGLSHSAVLCLFQDDSGLMWFGTYDGVNCYDGKGMEVFRSNPSKGNTLSNNVIHSISQADGSDLWITTHLGLNRFSRDSKSVTEVYGFEGDYSLNSNSNGDTWVLFSDSLFYYNTFHKKFVRAAIPFEKKQPLGNRAFTVESGALWYFPEGTGELHSYSLSSFGRDSISVECKESVTDFHTKPIDYLSFQNNIVCFIDRDMDLYVYDIARRSKIYIRNMASAMDRYGEISGIVPFYEDIMIAFKVNGLFRLRMSDRYSLEEIDSNVRIYSLYHDISQGILWVASDGQGALMYAREYPIASALMLDDLSPNLSRQVRSVMTDKYGDLWFGTKGDGLVRISPSDSGGYDKDNIAEAEVYFPGGSSPVSSFVRREKEFQVYKLLESRYHDGFWVGSGISGLLWYSFRDRSLHKVKEKAGKPLSDIHAMHEENDSTLYVAMADKGFRRIVVSGLEDGALEVEKDRRFTFYHEGREINMFYPMLPQGDSLLWLGSRGSGLVKFNRKTSEYQVISLTSMLHKSCDDILSLCLSRKGKLYVGTTSGLVSLSFEGGGKISAAYIGKEQGLFNDMIHGILEDSHGFVWLSTNRGLIKFNPENKSSHVYYYSAGVDVGEFSDDAYCRCPYTGNLFFGGIDGLVWMDKDVEASPDYYPDIQLRGLKVNRIPVGFSEYYTDSGTALKFGSKDRSFSISFAAPDFLSGREIEYSYMLEGYDRGWSIFSSGNEAFYSGVPTGRYVFKVKYKKDVFDAGNRYFSIPLYVRPPWYLSMGAIIFYALIVLAGLVSLILFIRRPVYGNLYSGDDIPDRKDEPDDLQERFDMAFGNLAEYAQTGECNVGAISGEVISIIGGNSDDIRIEIDVSLVFPWYKNILRLVFYRYYSLFHEAGGPASASACVNDGMLHLSFICGTPMVSKRGGFSDRMLDEMLRMTGATAEYSKDSQGYRTTVSFKAAALKEYTGGEKKTAIVTGTSGETVWSLSDLLAENYVVCPVCTSTDVLRLLRQSSPVDMLLVDADNLKESPEQFADNLKKNRPLLARTALVAMMSENTPLPVQQIFIMLSDTYVILPYGITLLKDIASAAVQSKSAPGPVYLGGSLSDKIECATVEETVFVKKMLGIVEENLEMENLGAAFIADRMNMGERQFYRTLKRVTSLTPGDIVKSCRLEKAASLLLDRNLSITDVLATVGISSRSYFYKEFAARFGMPPGEYREKTV